MALEFLRDCTLAGPAFPEPFVQFELERELRNKNLLPRTTGEPGRQLQSDWDAFRRRLRELVARGGSTRVRHQVLEPLLKHLGYVSLEKAEDVQTREGEEPGGHLMKAENGSSHIRAWSVDLDIDLDAPAKRGQAYRFSPVRIAQRVLLATGERLGLISNGVELRLLISDPARTDSQIIFSLDPSWKRSRAVPDSFLLLLSLASPAGVTALPDLLDKARLQQVKVTKDLRVQAREAIALFIQEVLDHPDNQEKLLAYTDRERLAKDLWHEGLILIYRLLFILKEEASDDPARSFKFASSSLWRNTYSPTTSLAPLSQKILLQNAETGRVLEDGVRSLFRLFTDGLECSELHVRPLGGVLFGENSTPILSQLAWGEKAVALLMDRLLWTTPNRRGSQARRRVHYGPLDVEDLGRVYEALLELEPGIATEPMCRLRRSKLEVVVPLAQGERYRPTEPVETDLDEDAEDEEETEEEESGNRRGGTRVQWIEAIPPHRFYLRVGLGRKASGSYYTPRSFVKFLVKETLGPLIEERSPRENPQPSAILKLKVLDPAMGSGHFLVEACRFLGDALYEAFRQCDELAAQAERDAEDEKHTLEERKQSEKRAREFRDRITGLCDPDETLEKYLPSRAPEGEERGLSRSKALALCRRMAAVHCLYGVDKNPLAVELAKLSLWIESHAEGMPLTFLDHRLVVGDSLTGPFWINLLMRPGCQRHIENESLWNGLIQPHFTNALSVAIRYVRQLESKIGISMPQIEEKQRLKHEMDRQLAPFRALAAAWTGGVMLGSGRANDGLYETLVTSIANSRDLPETLPDDEPQSLREMLARGLGVEPEEVPMQREALYDFMHTKPHVPAVAYDLTFPEVFYPTGVPHGRKGFDVVLGNPPWDRIEIDPQDFFGQFDFRIYELNNSHERESLIKDLLIPPERNELWKRVCNKVEGELSVHSLLYFHQVTKIDGSMTVGRPDLYRLFVERFYQLANAGGYMTWIVPYSFHSKEGSTGVRKLYIFETKIRFLYSFENKNKKFFDIDSRFRFDILVAQKMKFGKIEVKCAFYLHDQEWLFCDKRDREEVLFTDATIRLTGGNHHIFVEVKTQPDLDLIITQTKLEKTCWGDFTRKIGVKTAFGMELHRNPAFNNIFDITMAVPELYQFCEKRNWEIFPIHEGKTIYQHQDYWDTNCSHFVKQHDAFQSRHWKNSIYFFRFVYRRTAASSNERSMIAAIITPGFVCEQTLAVESHPFNRKNCDALLLLSLANSTIFDWQVRHRITTDLSHFLLNPIPIPELGKIRTTLSHLSLILNSNHKGYKPLWDEQLLGLCKSDPKLCYFPVISNIDERWELISAIDALIANAYGLTEELYKYILSTFNHNLYHKAPALCLAKFAELKAHGLETFIKKYDPYWDIPLNENLPQPVIDIPMPGEREEGGVEGVDFEYNLLGEKIPIERDLFGNPMPPKKARRKSRK